MGSGAWQLPKELVGLRFGRLTVERLSDVRTSPRKGRRLGRVKWLCRCECGREITARGDRLVGGRAVSCGRGRCRYPLLGAAPRVGDLTYSTWKSMFWRCGGTSGDPKVLRNYSGRGITVCERWREFENFLADMGPRPSPGHSIDRIDNDGNYEPGNCRWATLSEQRRNTRFNFYVERDGARVLLIELTESLGLNYEVVHGRLVNGWPLDRALTKPIRTYTRRPSTVSPSPKTRG